MSWPDDEGAIALRKPKTPKSSAPPIPLPPSPLANPDAEDAPDNDAAATTRTLTALSAAHGASTLAEAQKRLHGRTKAALVREGAKVATSRISTDAARLYGEASDFFAHATKTQRAQLPTISTVWLRIAIGTALLGNQTAIALGAQKSSAATTQSSTRRKETAQRVLVEAKRDQLDGALQDFAGGDESLLVHVETAHGVASELTKAVLAQVALVRAWRKTPPNAEVAALLADSLLDDAWLDEADALATAYGEVKNASKATRNQGKVTQAELDFIDGMNLVFLTTLVGRFEAAHLADPAIPKLHFSSLSSHTRRSHNAKPAPTSANPTPSEGAPASE